MKILLAAAAMVFLAQARGVSAAVSTGTVEYVHGNTKLEGYLAYDPALPGKRPGIVVFHEWTGPGAYEKSRAEQLAALGYVALAADIYGKGVRPANTKEAAAEAGKYRGDRALLRGRARAALDELKKLPQVDPGRTAAIGYCFGGGAALELARSGAELGGAASFHGNLDTPAPTAAGDIKARIVVFHGGDDPFVSSAAVAGFEEEMRGAGADWQLVVYGGAVHRFSNPSAGSDVKSGAAYNEAADRRSWQALKDFFFEIFNNDTAAAVKGEAMENTIYDFTVKDAAGGDYSLAGLKGKVVLIVNVASKCGFTPQYEGLQALYKKYSSKGLAVLGFPCNQFNNQEPGTNEEIQRFCRLNYGVEFPVMGKLEVNGPGADPLYVYLKKTAPGVLGSEAVKWNFTKFLVDRTGKVIARYAPATKPEDLASDLEKALGR